jgi:hypothetical protein
MRPRISCHGKNGSPAQAHIEREPPAGVVSCDLGLNRDFSLTERFKLQFRGEAFNLPNTPHFALPGTNVSNMVLNTDGSIRNLAGYSQILSTQNLGRDFDERQIRFSLRVSF